MEEIAPHKCDTIKYPIYFSVTWNCSKIEKLYETLNKLDYIGKKKENIELFVAETDQKDIVHTSKRHSFFIKD